MKYTLFTPNSKADRTLNNVSDDLKIMPVWSEDLSQFTVEEVVLAQCENRAWYKELRCKIAALIDTKLAKQISQEKYANEHNPLKVDLAECERRGRILGNEPMSRRKHVKPRLVSGI